MVSSDLAAMICHAHATIGDRVVDADYLIIARIIGRRIQEITSVPVDPDRAAELWVDTAGTMTTPPPPSASA